MLTIPYIFRLNTYLDNSIDVNSMCDQIPGQLGHIEELFLDLNVGNCIKIEKNQKQPLVPEP